MTELDPSHQPHDDRPEPPTGGELATEPVAFLRSQSLACLLLGTDRGSRFVLKAPAAEIGSMQGSIPILLRQELYRHRSSPVIRLLLRFYDHSPDRPPSSRAFESFVNVDDEKQRSDYGELARQDLVDLHVYDEALRCRLTKQIPNTLRADVPLVLMTALSLRARIPAGLLDFDRAKADVIARTSL